MGKKFSEHIEKRIVALNDNFIGLNTKPITTVKTSKIYP